MLIFPAIDLIGNKVVRLVRGDYEKKTVYADDPLKVAKGFYEAGAKMLHVVDLEGAKSGRTDQIETIRTLIEKSGLLVEVGGGVRRIETVRRYTALGAWRVILGTAAVDDHAFLEEAVRAFGEKIAVGVDIKGDRVMTRGWLADGGVSCGEFCARLQDLGVRTVICTDISRDGAMQGANAALYERLQRDFPKIDFVASGGVSSYDDIEKLRRRSVYGAIIGKALYTGAIDLKRAILLAQE